MKNPVRLQINIEESDRTKLKLKGIKIKRHVSDIVRDLIKEYLAN